MPIDVANDPLFKKFISEKNEESTKIRVERHLRHYCNFTNQTPTDLIKDAWYENKEELPPWEQTEDYGLKARLKKFKEDLESKNYSERTVKENIMVVKSFHSFFEIAPPKTNFKYRETDTADKVVKTVDDLPGKDEIRQALTFAELPVNAIILVMISSGMDASTVTSLRVRDFIEGLADMAITTENELLDIDKTRSKVESVNGPIIIWNVRRKKLGLKGHDYFTFSTPEAIMAILSYLEYHPPPTPDDMLFRTTDGNKIRENLFSYYFRELNRKCGFGKLGRYIYFRSHNLRKFFANSMDPVLGRRDTDYLMGHLREKNRVDGTYYKPDISSLSLLYKQHMDKISVTEEVNYREVTDERLQELKEGEKIRDEKIQKLEEMVLELLNNVK